MSNKYSLTNNQYGKNFTQQSAGSANSKKSRNRDYKYEETWKYKPMDLRRWFCCNHMMPTVAVFSALTFGLLCFAIFMAISYPKWYAYTYVFVSWPVAMIMGFLVLAWREIEKTPLKIFFVVSIAQFMAVVAFMCYFVIFIPTKLQHELGTHVIIDYVPVYDKNQHVWFVVMSSIAVAVYFFVPWILLSYLWEVSELDDQFWNVSDALEEGESAVLLSNGYKQNIAKTTNGVQYQIVDDYTHKKKATRRPELPTTCPM